MLQTRHEDKFHKYCQCQTPPNFRC